MVVVTEAVGAYAPTALRSLHLIDVENLVGARSFDAADVSAAEAAYRTLVGIAPEDQVILSSSHHNAKATWFGWGGNPRRLVRSGRDGADLALLEVIAREAVADRFERIVIGSGDGIFTEAVSALIAQGVRVTIAAHASHLSRQLSLAASEIRPMSSPGTATTSCPLAA